MFEFEEIFGKLGYRKGIRVNLTTRGNGGTFVILSPFHVMEGNGCISGAVCGDVQYLLRLLRDYEFLNDLWPCGLCYNSFCVCTY